MTAPGEVGDPRIQVPIRIEPSGKTMPASVPMATGSSIGDPVAIIPTDEFRMQYAAAPLRVPEVGETVVISRIRNEYGGIKFVGIPMAAATAPPLPSLFSVSRVGEPIIAIHISEIIPDWIVIAYAGHDTISSNGGRYTYKDVSYLFLSKHERFVEYGGKLYAYEYSGGSPALHEWWAGDEVYPSQYLLNDIAAETYGYQANDFFVHPYDQSLAVGYVWFDAADNSGNYFNKFDIYPFFVEGLPLERLTHTVTGPFVEYFQPYGPEGAWRWRVLDATSLAKIRTASTPTRIVYHYINQVNSELVSSRVTVSHDLTATDGMNDLQWCGNEAVVGTNGTNRIYTSQNGFVTYTTFESTDASHLARIGTWQTGEVWIIDSVDPVALRSMNYGRTWERVDLPTGVGHYTAVAVDPFGKFVLLGTDTGVLVRFNYEDPAWLAPLPLQQSAITTTKTIAPNASGFAVAAGYSGTAIPQADITLSHTGNDYWPSGAASVTFGGTFTDAVGEVIGIRGTLGSQAYGSSFGGIMTTTWGYTLKVNGVAVLTESFTSLIPTGSTRFEVLLAAPVTNPEVTLTFVMASPYSLFIPKNSGVTMSLAAEWIR